MTFNAAMEEYEKLRGTAGGEYVLSEMKRLGLTTKTDEGKAKFADLVEAAFGQSYGYPWGI